MLDQMAEATRARKRAAIVNQHLAAILVICGVFIPLIVVTHSLILVAVQYVLLTECLVSEFSGLRRLRKRGD